MPPHNGTLETRSREVLAAASRAMHRAGRDTEARLLALAAGEESSRHGGSYYEVLLQSDFGSRLHWEVHLYVPEEELVGGTSNVDDLGMKMALTRALRDYGIDDYVEIVYPLAASKPLRPNQGVLGAEGWRTVERDGLTFRSGAEMRFYAALKAAGVTMAPLPAVVHSRITEANRDRCEPDFLLFHAGRVAVVELDGPHHDKEDSATADLRLSPLTREGIPAVRIAYPETLTTEQAAQAAELVLAWIRDPETKPRIYRWNLTVLADT